jgi:hypothetical protein
MTKRLSMGIINIEAANPPFNVDAPHIAPRPRIAPRVRARVTRQAAARQLTLRYARYCTGSNFNHLQS